MVPSTVLFDHEAGLYKMWYLTTPACPGADSTYVTGYATSADGLRWSRPDVGAYAYEGSRRNNLCMVNTPGRHGRDPRRPRAGPRAALQGPLLARRNRSPADVARGWGATEQRGFYLGSSPDGARWTLAPDGPRPDRDGRHAVALRLGRGVRALRLVRPSEAGRREGPKGAPTRPRRVIGRSESEDGLTWSRPVDVLLPDADDPPRRRALLHAGAALPRALRGDRARLRPLARSVRPVLARADPQPGRHPLAAPQRAGPAAPGASRARRELRQRDDPLRAGDLRARGRAVALLRRLAR